MVLAFGAISFLLGKKYGQWKWSNKFYLLLLFIVYCLLNNKNGQECVVCLGMLVRLTRTPLFHYWPAPQFKVPIMNSFVSPPTSVIIAFRLLSRYANAIWIDLCPIRRSGKKKLFCSRIVWDTFLEQTWIFPSTCTIVSL